MLTADDKDPYVNALRRRMDKTREPYLLDRLLTGSVIEARGAERFSLIAGALEDGKLASFYTVLARSEAEHQSRFIELANLYFQPSEVQERLEFWLDEEATVSLKSRSGRVCIDESEGSSFEGSDQILSQATRSRN